MNDLLDRLQTCIASRFPAMAARLNPGASQASIDAFERALGMALPEPVRALYRWHDGSAHEDGPYVPGLFFGLRFRSLGDALSDWKSETAFLETSSDEYLASCAVGYTCLPAGTIRQRASSKAWIPLADDGGGAYLGIDLDPDAAGAVGQVISFGGREFTRVQASPGLEAFLEGLLGMYENGEYELVQEDDDAFSLGTVDPYAGHFLDYLLLKAERAR